MWIGSGYYSWVYPSLDVDVFHKLSLLQIKCMTMKIADKTASSDSSPPEGSLTTPQTHGTGNLPLLEPLKFSGKVEDPQGNIEMGKGSRILGPSSHPVPHEGHV